MKGVLPARILPPPKGAMVSSVEGIQGGKNWVTNGAAEEAAVAFRPAGVRFTAPGVVDPGTRHGQAPQIGPVADGPVLGMELGATDNAIDIGSDVQGNSHFSATDDLGTQQNEVKSFSVLLCGIDEKLSFFHGSVDGVIGTNSVSISLNYTQSEETAEMDQNFAGKFRNMNRSLFYFDNTVLVEEEPDPGGMGTPRIGLAQWMEEANSIVPANRVNQEYAPIKHEKPQASSGMDGKLQNKCKRIKQGSPGLREGEIDGLGHEDGTGKGRKRALGDDLIAADGETKNVRVKEGVEEVKVGENSVDKAGLPGQPCVPQ